VFCLLNYPPLFDSNGKIISRMAGWRKFSKSKGCISILGRSEDRIGEREEEDKEKERERE
jgi:hypothetical protein